MQNRSQPIVDFNKDRLAIIFLGTRNSGGYSALATQVVDGGGATATVMVTESVPGPKQQVTQQKTSPWVMIAVDRAKLDLRVSITKAVDTTPTGVYHPDPLTSITFLPWNPCGYGYGGNWADPCGFGFDNPNDFQVWCDRNNFDPSMVTGTINFNQSRLVFVGGGDYGLGFSLQIGEIFTRAGETTIQIRRGESQSRANTRPYVLVSVPRDTSRFNVEYLLSGSECYVGAGRALPLRQGGAFIYQNAKDWEKSTVENGAQTPSTISDFDYTKSNLGVVYCGELQPNINYSIDRVASRGQTAVVYLKKSISSVATPMNAPYFVLRFDKKVRNIKVVEL